MRFVLAAFATAAAALSLVLPSLKVVSAVEEERYYGTKEPDVEPPTPSPDWKRMGQPRPGDWLSVFKEPGQTFADYRKRASNLKSKRRGRLYLIPLGELADEQGDLLARALEYLRVFFCLELVELAPQPLPDQCYHRRRGQYDAGCVLDEVLVPIVSERKDALAMLGLTDRDLYHGRLNFVFGVGSHQDRVGLYSLYRFLRGIPPERDREAVALERTLKTSCHEIGHILGLAHCTFYHCLMNGSNSLDESDRRPLFLCPVCLAKLEWNLKLDRRERYRKMERFFASCKMKEQAAFCRRRIQELKPTEGGEREGD